MKSLFMALLLLARLILKAHGLDPLDGLDNAEWTRVRQDRNVLFPYLMDKLRVLNEKELIQNMDDRRLRKDVRAASALVLLADYESPELHLAALRGFSIECGPGYGEWEAGIDTRKWYPVAWAAGYRAELMPIIVKGTIEGAYEMRPMKFVVLEQYRRNGPDPRPLLLKLREEATADGERQRCDELLQYMGKDAYPKLPGEQLRNTPAIAEFAAWAPPKRMAQNARPVLPPPRPPKPESPPVAPADPPAAGASTVATAPGGEAVAFRDRSFVWLSVSAAALAGAAAWFFLRSRRKG